MALEEAILAENGYVDADDGTDKMSPLEANMDGTQLLDGSNHNISMNRVSFHVKFSSLLPLL